MGLTQSRKYKVYSLLGLIDIGQRNDNSGFDLKSVLAHRLTLPLENEPHLLRFVQYFAVAFRLVTGVENAVLVFKLTVDRTVLNFCSEGMNWIWGSVDTDTRS